MAAQAGTACWAAARAYEAAARIMMCQGHGAQRASDSEGQVSSGPVCYSAKAQGNEPETRKRTAGSRLGPTSPRKIRLLVRFDTSTFYSRAARYKPVDSSEAAY
jgi:hypothetical protein